jgi:hypothetical protein
MCSLHFRTSAGLACSRASRWPAFWSTRASNRDNQLLNTSALSHSCSRASNSAPRFTFGGKSERIPKFHDQEFILLQRRAKFVTPRRQFPWMRRTDQDLSRLLRDEFFLHWIEPSAVRVQDREAIRKMMERHRPYPLFVLRGEPRGRRRCVACSEHQGETFHDRLDPFGSLKLRLKTGSSTARQLRARRVRFEKRTPSREGAG